MNRIERPVHLLCILLLCSQSHADGDAEVPFICDVDYQSFIEAFPKTPQTPLEVAIQRSIEFFLKTLTDNKHQTP